jgi:hypothetical protein
MGDTPVTLALRTAALATLFENRVANNINRSAVLLQLLPKIPADAKNISWDAQFGTAVPTTAAIADGVDVTNFNADEKIPATLAYAIYHDAFAVTGLAEAAARIVNNPTQLSDLIGDEMNDALDRLGAAIGRGIYWGTAGSNTMLGLCAPPPATSSPRAPTPVSTAAPTRSGLATWSAPPTAASRSSTSASSCGRSRPPPGRSPTSTSAPRSCSTRSPTS